MRMLADQKDEAFELLRLAVNQPRFDQPPIDRIRSQIVSGIIASQRTPEAKAQDMWREAIYGTHPYARKDEGTAETLASIKPDDLKAFHKAMFARDNLHVAVVGAIDAETLKVVLDKVFGELPEKAKLDAGCRCAAEARPDGPRAPTTSRRRRSRWPIPASRGPIRSFSQRS